LHPLVPPLVIICLWNQRQFIIVDVSESEIIKNGVRFWRWLHERLKLSILRGGHSLLVAGVPFQQPLLAFCKNPFFSQCILEPSGFIRLHIVAKYTRAYINTPTLMHLHILAKTLHLYCLICTFGNGKWKDTCIKFYDRLYVTKNTSPPQHCL
jgi:hypothetical protein